MGFKILGYESKKTDHVYTIQSNKQFWDLLDLNAHFSKAPIRKKGYIFIRTGTPRLMQIDPRNVARMSLEDTLNKRIKKLKIEKGELPKKIIDQFIDSLN